eukprot:jgi/Galph1/3800/GphlegSOOS_G2450.1
MEDKGLHPPNNSTMLPSSTGGAQQLANGVAALFQIEDILQLQKDSTATCSNLHGWNGELENNSEPPSPRDALSLPSALECLNKVVGERVLGRKVVFFLDYDGTLSPIVDDPDTAFLPKETKAALEKLTQAGIPVAIVSGRSRTKVQNFVNIDSLFYAGSHGFDICGPDGFIVAHQVAKDVLPVLAEAAEQAKQRIIGLFPGAAMEDNLLSKTIHYRRCYPEAVAEIEMILDDILKDYPQLRKTYGKCVFEIRPKIDWDKGKAVEWLMSALALNSPDIVPIYIGDDRTDEDAFRVIGKKGVTVIVANEPIHATHAHYRLKDPFEVQKFLEDFRSFSSTENASCR